MKIQVVMSRTVEQTATFEVSIKKQELKAYLRQEYGTPSETDMEWNDEDVILGYLNDEFYAELNPTDGNIETEDSDWDLEEAYESV